MQMIMKRLRQVILYQRPGNQNFHVLDAERSTERPLLSNDSTGWIFGPCPSPDGSQVAVYWNRKVEGEGLWLISLADDSQTLLQEGNSWPIGWSADGEWLFAWNYSERPVRIRKIRLDGSESRIFVTLPFEQVGSGGITMTADGNRIICSVEEAISDVWLLENFDPKVK